MLKINVLVKNLSCKKFQSNSDAKLKIAIVFLSENNKNEYQHSISSTSNINFMSVLRFEGGLFKKVPRAVSKRGPTSKKFWMSHFFGSRQKSNTHASKSKLKNDPERVCPIAAVPSPLIKAQLT